MTDGWIGVEDLAPCTSTSSLVMWLVWIILTISLGMGVRVCVWVWSTILLVMGFRVCVGMKLILV